jgi:hypothetical protein
MYPPGESAVEGAHTLRESAAGEPYHEVVVVLHERPIQGLPAVFVGVTAVQGEIELVVGGRLEKRSSITTARRDVVVAEWVDLRVPTGHLAKLAHAITGQRRRHKVVTLLGARN